MRVPRTFRLEVFVEVAFVLVFEVVLEVEACQSVRG